MNTPEVNQKKTMIFNQKAYCAGTKTQIASLHNQPGGDSPMTASRILSSVVAHYCELDLSYKPPADVHEVQVELQAIEQYLEQIQCADVLACNIQDYIPTHLLKEAVELLYQRRVDFSSRIRRALFLRKYPNGMKDVLRPIRKPGSTPGIPKATHKPLSKKDVVKRSPSFKPSRLNHNS